MGQITPGPGTVAQMGLGAFNHGIRNGAASLGNVTDKRVTPHLNPHLSRTAMNIQAAKQSGGVSNSYKVTFKELIKKVRNA